MERFDQVRRHLFIGLREDARKSQEITVSAFVWKVELFHFEKWAVRMKQLKELVGIDPLEQVRLRKPFKLERQLIPPRWTYFAGGGRPRIRADENKSTY